MCENHFLDGFAIAMFFVAPLLFGGGWWIAQQLTPAKRAEFYYRRELSRRVADYIKLGLPANEAWVGNTHELGAIKRATDDMRREATEAIKVLA